MAAAFSHGTPASGSYSSRAAKPSTIPPLVGTARTVLVGPTRIPAWPPAGCCRCWAATPPRPKGPTRQPSRGLCGRRGSSTGRRRRGSARRGSGRSGRCPHPLATATTRAVRRRGGSTSAGDSPAGTPPHLLGPNVPLRPVRARSVTLMLAGPARVECRLRSKSPDVVGVDVAVPQSLASHHDDGVPDSRPHLLEGPHGVIGSLGGST